MYLFTFLPYFSDIFLDLVIYIWFTFVLTPIIFWRLYFLLMKYCKLDLSFSWFFGIPIKTILLIRFIDWLIDWFEPYFPEYYISMLIIVVFSGNFSKFMVLSSHKDIEFWINYLCGRVGQVTAFRIGRSAVQAPSGSRLFSLEFFFAASTFYSWALFVFK